MWARHRTIRRKKHIAKCRKHATYLGHSVARDRGHNQDVGPFANCKMASTDRHIKSVILKAPLILVTINVLGTNCINNTLTSKSLEEMLSGFST